jgi:hypothetical protein
VAQVRHAAFVEEDGVVLLVVHSRATKRQLSFEISAVGQVVAITIDEQYVRRESRVEPGNTDRLTELAAWLQGR